MVCIASPAPDAFASGLLSYLDCQAVTLGAQGYQALAAPGSSVVLLLTALLAIFIALIGYRMLFGETVTVREGVMSAVKVGIVLAFATSWPAYRTVVFDVVLRAPADLAAEIGRSAGPPGATGDLATRMDGTDRAFRILAIYGVGMPTKQQVEQAEGVAPPLFANFDMFALGAARVVFLVGSLGAFTLLRLAAGLLLALGPLFIAFLLFGATRGLAEGWLRALTAATLGSCAVAVAIGIELALLEPWLTDLVTRRASGIAIPGIPAAMLATATIFAFATAGLLALVTRIAFTVAVPTALLRGDPMVSREDRGIGSQLATMDGRTAIPAESRSRAAAVADSIVATQRREEQVANAGLSRADGISGSVLRGDSVRTAPGPGTSLGQSFRRRATLRGSGSAIARDRRA